MVSSKTLSVVFLYISRAVDTVFSIDFARRERIASIYIFRSNDLCVSSFSTRCAEHVPLFEEQSYYVCVPMHRQAEEDQFVKVKRLPVT